MPADTAGREPEGSAAIDGDVEAGAARKRADDWVLAGLRALSAGSVADVKVERLAVDLGVTKGSFYWHFQGRPALLAAMRDRWVADGTEAFIAMVEELGGSDDPVAALEALFRATVAAPDAFDGLETAMRDWAANDKATAEVCAEVDERRLDYVTSLLVAAGVESAEARRRADVLYRVVIGEHVWCRYGGDPVDIDTVISVVGFLSRP